MTTEQDSSENSTNFSSFGARLRQARENLHLSEKDVAARLNLKASVIQLIESDDYSKTTPSIFLRGYLRSYARLLDFNDAEIALALSQIDWVAPSITPRIAPITSENTLERNQPAMRLSTYGIVLLLTGLVGTWWYIHSYSRDSTPPDPTEIQAAAPAAAVSATVTAATPAATPPVVTTPSVAATTTPATPTATAPPAAPPEKVAETKAPAADNDTADDDEDDKDEDNSNNTKAAVDKALNDPENDF